MKNIYLITLIFVPFFVQSQNWQWAKQAGGNAMQSYDAGSVITDGTNYYLYGTFSGAMYLQTDTFLGTNGNSDFFIIKYDAIGTELWAKSFGGYNGTNQFESIGCVYDSVSKCIYMSGSFWGNMVLDNDTVNGSTYFNNFIAKMDSSGNFLWAKNAWTKNTFNSSFNDGVPVIFISPTGILYLTTSIIDTAYFDSFQVNSGGCLAKFNSNGNCIYVRHLFNDNIPSINQVQLKFINNDLIMYGNFQQTFTVDTAILISNGNYDMFISRADNNGNIIWINKYGYAGLDVISRIDIDNSNNIYAACGFTDSISISGNSFHNISTDILLLKFSANGNYIWGKQTYATGNIASANAIVSDGDGNCYIAGTFSGSLSFDSYTISTSNLFDMFLSRYDNNGNCLGVRHFGKANCANVVSDNSGNPSVAGEFANTVTIGSNTFTSNGPFDVYLAKSDILTGIGGEGRMANNQLIIYANPNAGKCNITVPDDFLHEKNLTLSIYDNTGKLIQQKTLQMNDGKINLNLEAEAKGIYNVTLNNSSKSYNGKIIFE